MTAAVRRESVENLSHSSSVGMRPMDSPAFGFHFFVLKLVSFCNLNCSYCYMFNSLDQSYRDRPRYMSIEIAMRALRAIRRYLTQRSVHSTSITLHGGEPTLWPLDSFRALFGEIRSMREDGFAVELSMQTNLWRLPDWELFHLCREYGVSIGVSLDGPPEANDANRKDFSGRGSYNRIIKNVQSVLAHGFGDLLAGFLCVMQPRIEPKAYIEWLASLPVTRVDLLWPIGFNQANKPWNHCEEAHYAANPVYGEWLQSVFEEWWGLDRPELDIRLFADAVESKLGGSRRTDMMGAYSFASLVVNTDGAIEMTDYFRTAMHNGSRTGYSIVEHDLALIARDPRFSMLRQRAQRVPRSCRTCSHLHECRGGTLSGRLNAAGEVTSQHSVLCHDHKRFFDTVARYVDAERLMTSA